MNQSRTRLATLWQRNALAGDLLRGGLGSLTARMAEVFLGLVLLALLARGLGAEGLGVYAFSLALVSVLSVPARLGLPPLLVRETARGQAADDWAPVRGLWHLSSLLAFGVSVALGLFLAFFIWAGAVQDEILRRTLLWSLPLIPLSALVQTQSAKLRGLRHVVAGTVPAMVIRPVLLIVLVTIVLLTPVFRLTPPLAMGQTVFAALIALIFVVWRLRRVRPVQMNKTTPVYKNSIWLRSAWPLALSQGLEQINRYLDIMLLGVLAVTIEVGVYRVAAQGALLVSLGLTALTMVIAPFVTRLNDRQEIEKLQKLATYTARAAVAFAIPAVLAFALIGDWLLSTIFGQDFSAAYWPLLILAIGQLGNTAFGACGLLLKMTGHEKEVANSVAGAASINVFANILLIPIFGVTGAAVATALSLVLWNIWLWQKVKKRLGIKSSAF